MKSMMKGVQRVSRSERLSRAPAQARASRRIPRDPSQLRDRVQPAHTHKIMGESVCVSDRLCTPFLHYWSSNIIFSQVCKNCVIFLSLSTKQALTEITKVLIHLFRFPFSLSSSSVLLGAYA